MITQPAITTVLRPLWSACAAPHPACLPEGSADGDTRDWSSDGGDTLEGPDRNVSRPQDGQRLASGSNGFPQRGQ